MTSENHDSTEELGCVSRLLQESRYLAPKQNNLRVKKPETEPEEAKKKKEKKVIVQLLHVGNRACIKKSIVTNIQNLNLWFRYLTLADCSFM